MRSAHSIERGLLWANRLGLCRTQTVGQSKSALQMICNSGTDLGGGGRVSIRRLTTSLFLSIFCTYVVQCVSLHSIIMMYTKRLKVHLF